MLIEKAQQALDKDRTKTYQRFPSLLSQRALLLCRSDKKLQVCYDLQP